MEACGDSVGVRVAVEFDPIGFDGHVLGERLVRCRAPSRSAAPNQLAEASVWNLSFRFPRLAPAALPLAFEAFPQSPHLALPAA